MIRLLLSLLISLALTSPALAQIVISGNNVFTPQGYTISGVNAPPVGTISTGFGGPSAVYLPDQDRIYYNPQDGTGYGYNNHIFFYNYTTHVFSRIRPDPTGVVNGTVYSATTNNLYDRFAPMTADNKAFAYDPIHHTLWNFQSGFSAQCPVNDPNIGPPNADQCDAVWAYHVLPATTDSGAYIWDPATHEWSKPKTQNYPNVDGYTYPGAGGFRAGYFNWSPPINKFVLGGGETVYGPSTATWEIDPSVGGPGGTATLAALWTSGTGAGPDCANPFGNSDNRTNAGGQFVYHERAQVHVLIGGASGSNLTFCDASNNGDGNGAYPPGTTLARYWVYHPIQKTWEARVPLGARPPPMSYAACWYDSANNRIPCIGGRKDRFTQQTDVWVLNLEENTWTQIPGLTWASRYSSPVVYLKSQNAAIIFPTICENPPTCPDSPVRDVVAFRLAIPRAAMDTHKWYAIQNVFPTMANPEKHTSGTYLPSTTPMASSGVVYLTGGDSNIFSGPVPTTIDPSGHLGARSYQQISWSIDFFQKFSNPGNLTAGTLRLEDWCTNGTKVKPRHSDFMGWVGRIKDHTLWQTPGGQYVGAADDSCPANWDGAGAAPESYPDGGVLFPYGGFTFFSGGRNATTVVGGDDANYLWGHLLSFDPVTLLWTDRGPNHGLTGFQVTNGGATPYTQQGKSQWKSHYDAVNDTIVRIQNVNSGVNRVDVLSSLDTTPTWTFTSSGTTFGDWGRSYTAFDPTRRRIYIAERESFGLMFAMDLDNPDGHGYYNLGNLPVTSNGSLCSSSASMACSTAATPGDKGFTVFDYNARKLVYMELINVTGSMRVWVADVDLVPSGGQLTWVDITDLYPKVTLGGESMPSCEAPHGTAGVFDPDNNLLWIYGGYTSGGGITCPGGSIYSGVYSWAIRLSDMGTSGSSGGATIQLSGSSRISGNAGAQ
jgi:hypothetical protein